jgi:hypothetical protein
MVSEQIGEGEGKGGEGGALHLFKIYFCKIFLDGYTSEVEELLPLT